MVVSRLTMSILVAIGVLSFDGRRGTSHLGQYSFFVNSDLTSDVPYGLGWSAGVLVDVVVELVVEAGVEPGSSSLSSQVTIQMHSPATRADATIGAIHWPR